MPAEIFTPPSRALDANADPYSGALAYFYATGTTTPQSVYTTSGLGTPHANPVVADAGGKFAPIYFNAELIYRVVIKNAAGSVTLHDIDPVNTSTLATLSGTGGSALIGWLETGTGAVARTVDALLREQAISVIDFIPANLRAGIVANTGTTELVSYFDAAATACVTQNRALYVPRGTYAMQTWSPPANLRVVTDGRKTIFKQLDTVGVTKRIIHVAVDGVSLWEGGSATLDGSINTIPGNATEQNHGIFVEAQTDITINHFTVGDCYGKNIGGDVFCTYSPGGTIGHCEAGTLYGDNIYRNIASITGGKSGRIAGIIQREGAGVGCGLGALFWEPDPANTSAPSQWSVGMVRGRTITVAGDPNIRLGDIRIGVLHLDYTVFGVSTPVYDVAGFNVTTQPDAFLHALRCRNFRNLHIGQMYVKDHPRSAIYDLGSAAGDDLCDSFRVDALTIDGVGSGAGFIAEIILQKQRKFSVGTLVHVNKPTLGNPTFLGGADCALIQVEGGEIKGRVCNGQVGAFLFENVKQTSLGAENIFRNVDGKIRLRGGSGAGVPAVMFENCPITPVVEDWTGDGAAISGTTVNVRYVRSTVNAISYADAWAVTQAAVASAATITLPKYGDVIPISGTTTITGITADAGHKGRTVTLVFQAALTFTDGGSLLLAGNLVTTADDTITIATADGTTWYEVCRSVN